MNYKTIIGYIGTISKATDCIFIPHSPLHIFQQCLPQLSFPPCKSYRKRLHSLLHISFRSLLFDSITIMDDEYQVVDTSLCFDTCGIMRYQQCAWAHSLLLHNNPLVPYLLCILLPSQHNKWQCSSAFLLAQPKWLILCICIPRICVLKCKELLDCHRKQPKQHSKQSSNHFILL